MKFAVELTMKSGETSVLHRKEFDISNPEDADDVFDFLNDACGSRLEDFVSLVVKKV